MHGPRTAPQCANAQTRSHPHTMMRPDEAEDMSRPWRAKFAALAIVWAMASWSSSSPTAAGTDYFSQRIPRPILTAPGRVVPQHAYLGDTPASWPQAVHWRYNDNGAPGDLGLNPDATIQQLIDASAAWTAVCGVQIAFDGPTSSAPGAVTGGRPDLANVIGWQVAGERRHGRNPLLDRCVPARRRHHRRCRYLDQPDDGDDTRDAGSRSSRMNGDTRSASGTRPSRTR